MINLPSHNHSASERRERRQNWKADMKRNAPAISTDAADKKFDKQAAAFIAAGRVEAVSSTETRVYTGAGKTFYPVYKIKGAFKCECRDEEAYGFCAHEKAAALAAVPEAAPVDPATIRLDDRQRELAEATLQAKDSDLQVFNGFEFGTYFVVNPVNRREYRVVVKTVEGQTLLSCGCPDFRTRGRICRHGARVIRLCFLGLRLAATEAAALPTSCGSSGSTCFAAVTKPSATGALTKWSSMPKEFDLENPADQGVALEAMAAFYALYPEIAGLLTEAAGQIMGADEWRSELFESI